MWKYSRGQFDYTRVRKWKYSVFKTLRVNSLKRAAARHVQPSSDRVNLNHRWNIFHSPDTFTLIRFNLKEGKVTLKIIVFITVESVRESSNDVGMPRIITNAILIRTYHMEALEQKKGKKNYLLRWDELINHRVCNNSLQIEHGRTDVRTG